MTLVVVAPQAPPPRPPRAELLDADLIAARAASEREWEALRNAAREAEAEVTRLAHVDAARPSAASLRALEQARDNAKSALSASQRAKAIHYATIQKLCATQHDRARERLASFTARRAELVDALSTNRLELISTFHEALHSEVVRQLEARIASLTAEHVELERVADDARWVLNEPPDGSRNPHHLRSEAERRANTAATGWQVTLLRSLDETRQQFARDIEFAKKMGW